MPKGNKKNENEGEQTVEADSTVKTPEGEEEKGVISNTTEKKGDETMAKSNFQELEGEINDPALFLGTIAYLKKMKEYKKNPKAEYMELEEFNKEIERFKKEKIYPEIIKVKENG